MAHLGNVWLQLVSVMQPTFKKRPNGNRADLMERMAAMHTHFTLPGGNFVGRRSVGGLVQLEKDDRAAGGSSRPLVAVVLLVNRRAGPAEFLEWCEDLKIEPVLAVYAGYSLKGDHVAPGEDLEPYVQSALDEVEYVTGDQSLPVWGAERARDGHPAPFPLHYVRSETRTSSTSPAATVPGLPFLVCDGAAEALSAVQADRHRSQRRQRRDGTPRCSGRPLLQIAFRHDGSGAPLR